MYGVRASERRVYCVEQRPKDASPLVFGFLFGCVVCVPYSFRLNHNDPPHICLCICNVCVLLSTYFCVPLISFSSSCCCSSSFFLLILLSVFSAINCNKWPVSHAIAQWLWLNGMPRNIRHTPRYIPALFRFELYASK